MVVEVAPIESLGTAWVVCDRVGEDDVLDACVEAAELNEQPSTVIDKTNKALLAALDNLMTFLLVERIPYVAEGRHFHNDNA